MLCCIPKLRVVSSSENGRIQQTVSHIHLPLTHVRVFSHLTDGFQQEDHQDTDDEIEIDLCLPRYRGQEL